MCVCKETACSGMDWKAEFTAWEWQTHAVLGHYVIRPKRQPSHGSAERSLTSWPMQSVIELFSLIPRGYTNAMFVMNWIWLALPFFSTAVKYIQYSEKLI